MKKKKEEAACGFDPGPATQACYGCGKAIPSGFKLCDSCFFKVDKKESKNET